MILLLNLIFFIFVYIDVGLSSFSPPSKSTLSFDSEKSKFEFCGSIFSIFLQTMLILFLIFLISKMAFPLFTYLIFKDFWIKLFLVTFKSRILMPFVTDFFKILHLLVIYLYFRLFSIFYSCESNSIVSKAGSKIDESLRQSYWSKLELHDLNNGVLMISSSRFSSTVCSTSS